MRIVIIGGFLGAGKTTLLIQLAQHAQSQRNATVAIIENEVGSVGIDDKVMEAKGYAVTRMLSGCACCTLKADLAVALTNIQADLRPDYLFIEATGMAVPDQLAWVCQQTTGEEPRCITLVDAKRWRRMSRALELAQRQLKGAQLILVSKADLVDAEELLFVDASLNELGATQNRIRVLLNAPLPSPVLGSLLPE